MSDALLSLCPDNPHYLSFCGTPTVLITSGEHYGGVMNLDFDYRRYFDVLVEEGFNLTRLFSGTYRELPGSHSIRNNTMAPKPERFLCPWLCVEKGPNLEPLKWDLSQWDEAYWQRLRDFVAEAGTRGIVVEYVFFCFMYTEELWRASPMHPGSNVNELTVRDRNGIFSLGQADLLAYQEALVRKAAQELNAFDNVYFEIVNEPYCVGDGGIFLEWQHHLVDVLAEAEAALPNRHLIAINYQNRVTRVAAVHPKVAILNFHYAVTDAVAWNYHHDRVLSDDETGFKGWTDSPYRTEAWAFMLSGGGIFSHLDYTFTVDHPDGTAAIVAETPGHGGPAWRAQLGVLKRFLDGFDLPRMVPSPDAVALWNSVHLNAIALAEPGEQYAIYVWGGGPNADLSLALPAGSYKLAWLNPTDGRVIRTERLHAHPGGSRVVRTPLFLEDLALRILRCEADVDPAG